MMFKRKFVKIYTPVKEGENWRIRTNKEIKRHSTKGRYCKTYEVPPTKMVWSCWKKEEPTNAKTNCNSYICKEQGIEEDRLKDGGMRVTRM
jgi:hypothetical protein